MMLKPCIRSVWNLTFDKNLDTDLDIDNNLDAVILSLEFCFDLSNNRRIFDDYSLKLKKNNFIIIKPTKICKLVACRFR